MHLPFFLSAKSASFLGDGEEDRCPRFGQDEECDVSRVTRIPRLRMFLLEKGPLGGGLAATAAGAQYSCGPGFLGGWWVVVVVVVVRVIRTKGPSADSTDRQLDRHTDT
jgi:hypothetical protein